MVCQGHRESTAGTAEQPGVSSRWERSAASLKPKTKRMWRKQLELLEKSVPLKRNWYPRTVRKTPWGRGLTHRALQLVKMQIPLKKRESLHLECWSSEPEGHIGKRLSRVCPQGTQRLPQPLSGGSGYIFIWQHNLAAFSMRHWLCRHGGVTDAKPGF